MTMNLIKFMLQINIKQSDKQIQKDTLGIGTTQKWTGFKKRIIGL